MTDTSGVVPAIDGDQTGGPWVELWATGSNAYTSLSARFRSLLGMWVAYIMFTIRTCGGNLFCPPVFGCRGSSSSSLCDPLSLFSAFNLPTCLNTQQSLLVWLAGFSGVPCI